MNKSLIALCSMALLSSAHSFASEAGTDSKAKAEIALADLNPAAAASRAGAAANPFAIHLFQHLDETRRPAPKLKRYKLTVQTPAHYTSMRFSDHQNFFPSIDPRAMQALDAPTPKHYKSHLRNAKYFIPLIASNLARGAGEPVPAGYIKRFVNGKIYFFPSFDIAYAYAHETPTPTGYESRTLQHKCFEATL